jgi:hypothetical protein
MNVVDEDDAWLDVSFRDMLDKASAARQQRLHEVNTANVVPGRRFRTPVRRLKVSRQTPRK